jgi:hypothetical protein
MDNIYKNSAKIIISLLLIVVLLTAWAPWLTEDYGKEKVLEYFSENYGFNKTDIIITSVEKKPFEIHFGIVHNPSNKSLPESSVHAWVTFCGQVKHDKFMRLH